MAKKPYNTTQRSPDRLFERHVYNRDHLAHYLRWNFVIRRAKPGVKIMDIGCGDGGLLATLYHNRRTPSEYMGLDVRERTIEKLREKWTGKDWAFFLAKDICESGPLESIHPMTGHWDIITCFEVLEHVGRSRAPIVVDFIANSMGPDTIALIITPVYDSRVGAADNHIIEGEVGEMSRAAVRNMLEDKFEIIGNWGTFASVKDYKDLMTPEEKVMYDRLHAYYDADIISVLFAPLHPEASRNNIWEVRLK